jgi:acyl carrier protein
MNGMDELKGEVMQNAKDLGPEAIMSWLISEVEELLSVKGADLAVDEPLVNYGLSSMTGMMLSGDIETWLGIQLDPSVAWEYPTIESLAEYLAQEVQNQQPALAST